MTYQNRLEQSQIAKEFIKRRAAYMKRGYSFESAHQMAQDVFVGARINHKKG